MIEMKEILEAADRINPHISSTTIFYSPSLSEYTKAEIYLKPECRQIGGSFKVRGALNFVAAYKREKNFKGFVTCSSGNHGAALAYASSIFGHLPTTIFVPEEAEETKLEKIRRYGAEIVVEGKNFLEAYEAAVDYAATEARVYVHSHSHPLVIAGQGTIGLEIATELSKPSTVIVPVGGGGLISGIAIALADSYPNAEIIGVEPEAAPGAFLSFRDSFCHETVDIKQSLADGLLGTLTPLTYSIASMLVKQIVTVSEEDVRRAMKLFFRQEQMVVEGAASVGLAALLSGAIRPPKGPVVLVITGRNIGTAKFLDAINSA